MGHLYKGIIAIILFAGGSLFCAPIYAQNQFLFERLNVSDGLSDNQAICIHQDKEGFMWIGTMSGLNRYDGKTIKIYTHDPANNEAFFNQRISGISEDNFGNLWLKGFGGIIQLFNKEKHTIKNFPVEYGRYPKGPNSCIFLHDNGFAVLAFKNIGVFVIETKNNQCKLIGQYPFDGKTLQSDTYVNSIYAQDENNIWLTTRSGPIYLKIDSDTKKANFTHLSNGRTPNENLSVHYLKDSTLYFGVEGVGLVTSDIRSQSSEIINNIEGVDLKNITWITGENDKIWVSTNENGLLGFFIRSKKLQFHISNYDGIPLGYIDRLFTDSAGSIWFHATNFEGIFNYDPTENNLLYFPCDLSKSERLDNRNLIIFFNEDRFGNIWMGTRQDGVVYYDKVNKSINKITNTPQNYKSLIHNGLLSVFIDRNDNIWLGTQFGISKTNIREKEFGFIKHNKNPENEFENKTDALFKDSYGNIWCISNSGELFVYDSFLRLMNVFSDKKKIKGYKNALFLSFFEDSKGRLWMGSKGTGLFMLDLKKFHNNLEDASFTQYMPNESDQYSIQSNEIYDIIEDKNHRIWLATHSHGLVLILEKNDQIRFMSYNQFLEPFCPFIIQNGRCLLEDKSGKIWFGGLNGLCSFFVSDKDNLPSNVNFYYFDPQNPNTITYNDVKSLYEDHDGLIWIGTYGGGLNSFSPETGEFQHFSMTNGLANSIVYSTINDKEGNLWISTKNGLSKYVPIKNEFINYSESDGLPSNEFTESRPFLYNDKLFFGTILGVTYFNPEKLQASEKLPDILFTDLFVSNKVQEVDTEGALTKDINIAEKIELDYNQNNFSISFSMNDFQLKKKYRSEYILENFDENWVQAQSNQFITYTNISPGEYLLKLRLTDLNNTQITKEKVLQVIVIPPFWKTSWAFLIYLILAFVTTYFSFHVFRKFIALRNSLKLEKEITDFKLKFFTNISHELRTPLTLIINPLKEISGDLNLNGKSKGYLHVALNNAYNLLKLVNEILDFRKLQTNNMKLEISEIEIVSFLQKITDNFQFAADKKDICYEQSINITEKYYWFDPEKMEKILINLLTNAFKFTGVNGTIIISLLTEENQFSISIEDTGKGFDVEKRNKIFERFHEVDSNERTFFSQGVGIGLSLVEEFIKLHRGKLDLISEPGKGSRFTITLQGNKSFYREQELLHQKNWEIGSEAKDYTIYYQENKLVEQSLDFTKKEYRILLVEDNPELQHMLVQKLSIYYEISTANHGKDGLGKVATSPPDLIVTDLLMPEMDGIEMTKELKNNFQTCHIPVIMLTAKSTTEDKVEGYDSGADGYITKPFEFELLIAQINNLLEQRKILKCKFSKDLEFESRSVAVDKKDQKFIENVVTFVINHLDESDYTLQDIYLEMGFSKTVFYNKIKALTNLSPNHFVRTIKMKEAAKLLKSTTLNVSEVAFKIGYSDVNYFRNQFKKQFNQTPTDFLNS